MKTSCTITDYNGQVLKSGDVLRYNQHDRHIRQLRDGYLNEGHPSDRAMKKKWHDDALNARFLCLEIYNNGHCDGMDYQTLDPATGQPDPRFSVGAKPGFGAKPRFGSCMAHVMEKA